MRDHSPARRGRDGRGLPGPGHEAQSRGRHQGPAQSPRDRSRAAGALRARGAGARGAQSPEHRADLRRGGERRRARAGDGARRGSHAGGPDHAQPGCAAAIVGARRRSRGRDIRPRPSRGRCDSDRAAGGRGAGGSALRRHRAPGSQAGKHQSPSGRGREGTRLWPCPYGQPGLVARRRRHRLAHRPVPGGDGPRRHRGHGGIHGAGAGARPRSGRACGHLGVRRRAVRD